MKNTSILITGDIHLRDTQPSCRIDDFQNAQWGKIKWLENLQNKLNVPIIDSGDLFHHWKTSPWLLSQTIKHIPDIWTIPGNHDLPQHNLELLKNSGLYTLIISDKIHLIEQNQIYGVINYFGIPWDCKIPKIKKHKTKKNVLVIHKMVFKTKKEHWSNKSDSTAKQLLKKYPQFDLIITGHNHQTFVEKYEGRMLINPGSLTRQTIDQINHEPSVFLWDSITNKIDRISVPHEKDVFQKTVSQNKKARDERLISFVRRLKKQDSVELSFEKNMETFIANNKINKHVRDLIHQAMDKEEE